MSTIREAVIAAIKDGESSDYFSDGWRYDAWLQHLPDEARTIHMRNEHAASISPDNHADYWRMNACNHPEAWVARHYKEGVDTQ